MSDANFTKLARNRCLIDAIMHSRCVIRISSRAVRYSATADIDVSRRLTLTQSVGQRVVEWKGVERIKKVFEVLPRMLARLLPAVTMPQFIVQSVEIVADIKVALPLCARDRKVLGTPTHRALIDHPIGSSDLAKVPARHHQTGHRDRATSYPDHLPRVRSSSGCCRVSCPATS